MDYFTSDARKYVSVLVVVRRRCLDEREYEISARCRKSNKRELTSAACAAAQLADGSKRSALSPELLENFAPPAGGYRYLPLLEPV